MTTPEFRLPWTNGARAYPEADTFAAYLTDSTSTPEMVTRTYTARDWTTPTTVHYLYANSVYNGIQSVGTTVAFCGATGITATHRRDEITCDACKAEIGL